MTEQRNQQNYPQEEEDYQQEYEQQEEENPQYLNEENGNEYDDDQNYENYENITQNVQTTNSKIQNFPSGYTKSHEIITKKIYEYPPSYQTNKRSFSQRNETVTYTTNNYNEQNNNFNDIQKNINYQINRYTPDRENDTKVYYKDSNKKNYNYYESNIGYANKNEKLNRVKSAKIMTNSQKYNRGYSGNLTQRRNYNYYESSNCSKKRKNFDEQNNYSYDQPKIMSTIQQVTKLREGKKNYDDFMKNLRKEQNTEEITYENSNNYKNNNFSRRQYSYRNINSNNNNLTNSNRQYKYQFISSNNNNNNNIYYGIPISNSENNNYHSYKRSYKYKQQSFDRPINYRSDLRSQQKITKYSLPNRNIKVNVYDEKYYDPEKYSKNFVETQQIKNGRIEKKTETTLSKDAKYLISVSSQKKIYDNNENNLYGKKEITNENEEEIYELPEKNVKEVTTKLHTRPINLGDNYKYYESKHLVNPVQNFYSVTTHKRRGEMEIIGTEQYETKEVRSYQVQPQIKSIQKKEKKVVKEQYGDEGYYDDNEDNVNFEYDNENDENDNYQYYVSGGEYYGSSGNRYK